MMACAKLLLGLLLSLFGFIFFQPRFVQAQASFKQQFGSWLVFADKTSLGTEICFAVSEPTEKNRPDQYRSPPYIIFTKISKNNYEFMASSGYQYSSPPVELDIDGLYKFKLAPVEMQAWPFNELTDKEIIKYAPKGKEMIIRSFNSRSQEVIDKYTLDGLFKALNHIEEACK